MVRPEESHGGGIPQDAKAGLSVGNTAALPCCYLPYPLPVSGPVGPVAS